MRKVSTFNFQLSTFILVILLAACHSGDPLTVSSPDCSIEARFSLDSVGTATIGITVDGEDYMTITDIGLTTLDSTDLVHGFTLADDGITCTEYEDTATLRWGENKHIGSHYRSAIYDLRNTDSVGMLLEVRVYDDGVTFSFDYSGLPDGLLIANESTTYHFATDGTGWSIPANFESYEFAYREQSISQTTDASTPFTFRLADGRWGSIHEAGLTGMPEMALRQTDSLGLQVWLCPDNSGTGTSFRAGSCILGAWRTVTIGRQAVELINSTLVLNCNRGCDTADYVWARPVKYVGIWWGMHLGINSWTPGGFDGLTNHSRHGATTENMLRYIDFAAANGIDAVLAEGWNRGWEQWGGTQVFDYLHAAPDYDLERIAAYARERGVQLIMHYETGGNIPHFEAQMDSAFQWCQDHGVHYAKTGYAGGFPDRELHHSLYGVEHYQRVVDCAARHRVCLDVHEPIKPTGLCRTHPNLMTGEGARGMEWNAWSDGNSPAHTTILPFTRLLAGPMDYTPGIFDITYRRIQDNPDCRQWNQKDARQCRVHTTLAKQCALWVVLYSPMVMAADLIENYEGHPMFQFFRDYNPDCDESRALMGEPGQYVVIVRRAGDTWYLGAVTNDEARDITVPLDFLEKRKEYTVTLYRDGDEAHYATNPTAYAIDTLRLRRSQPLRLHLAAGGGAAAVIR